MAGGDVTDGQLDALDVEVGHHEGVVIGRGCVVLGSRDAREPRNAVVLPRLGVVAVQGGDEVLLQFDPLGYIIHVGVALYEPNLVRTRAGVAYTQLHRRHRPTAGSTARPARPRADGARPGVRGAARVVPAHHRAAVRPTAHAGLLRDDAVMQLARAGFAMHDYGLYSREV